MSGRTHRSLRLVALALLAAMALWPRAKGGAGAAELSGTNGRHVATQGVAARAETTAAKLASPPRTAKLVVASSDETQLNN